MLSPRRRFRWQTFIAAFALTACVLGLAAACFIIEYNLRTTTYGQAAFTTSFHLEEGLPVLTGSDGETVVLIPEGWRGALYTLISAPWQVVLWVVEKEMEGIALLL